jgi:ATP-binding cassette, subfamily B, multidrug efflux pump
MEAVHHFSFFFAGIDTLQNLSLIAIFVFLFVFSHPGQSFQAGNFFTFSLYVVMVFRPLLDLAERYNILQSAMAAAERIFEVLDTSVEQEGPTPGLPLNEIQSIVFEDVWLAYEKDNWILKGLSLTLQKETSIALIGMTGSGKTSVLSLLLGFYPFQKGRILINGQEIQNYNLFNLRRQFSMIIQDPVIFSGSVADNIALYDSTITLQQIQESAAFVNLLPFIEKFPHQFDHYLTERGTSLSAGEMQLISLARAVAHRRSVLIFDEATANIDIHTEKIIQDALKKVFHHQTALIVAHRLSTIRDVHVIYVLHQGKVIESGTHDQLLHQGGVYEKLYRLQFIQSPF